jgi:DNA-directed RNA polymerase specialized sigma subunit
VARLDRAYREATAAIEAMPNLQRSFEGATRLTDKLTSMRAATAEKRAQIIVHIRNAESLSLTGLANRFGVSRARISQFVKAGKVDQAGEGEEEP